MECAIQINQKIRLIIVPADMAKLNCTLNYFRR